MYNTVHVFIDTEFNGYDGELISLALLSEHDADVAYYQVFTVIAPVETWVNRHVIPYVHEFPTSGCRLQTWLNTIARNHQADTIEIIADWPDDIRYFCRTLITGPGRMIDPDCRLTFALEREACEGPYRPAIPHNALSDAAANRLNYLRHMSDDEEE